MKVVVCTNAIEALDLLHHCLEEGNVIPGKHFRDELANDDLTFEDAWAVMRGGAIFEPPELDIRTGEWKWRIEGREPGGKWLAIVFCFKTVDDAFLITVFEVVNRAR